MNLGPQNRSKGGKKEKEISKALQQYSFLLLQNYFGPTVPKVTVMYNDKKQRITTPLAYPPVTEETASEKN